MAVNVSNVAIGQWRNITKKGLGLSNKAIEKKILCAINLGRPIFMYESKDYLIRYYDLNILISSTGIVLSLWRYNGQKEVLISELVKNHFQGFVTDSEIKLLASIKHDKVMLENFKMKKELIKQ